MEPKQSDVSQQPKAKSNAVYIWGWAIAMLAVAVGLFWGLLGR